MVSGVGGISNSETEEMSKKINNARYIKTKREATHDKLFPVSTCKRRSFYKPPDYCYSDRFILLSFSTFGYKPEHHSLTFASDTLLLLPNKPPDLSPCGSFSVEVISVLFLRQPCLTSLAF
jgi:hypothetical protein